MGRRDARVARQITSVPHARSGWLIGVCRPRSRTTWRVEQAASGHLRRTLRRCGPSRCVPRLGITSGQPPNLETTVLGSKVSMPVLLSPIGFTRMMHTAGDVAGVTAAGAARPFSPSAPCQGTPWRRSRLRPRNRSGFSSTSWAVVWGRNSSLSGHERVTLPQSSSQWTRRFPAIALPREQVRAVPAAPFDRRTATKMARFVATRPHWLIDQALDGFQLDLVHSHASKHNSSLMTADEGLLEWIAQPPRWSDLEWIRESFGGPIVVKGVLSPEDARRAVDSGASALIVSNHGGRQLDGAPASFSALPKIIRSVGHEVEVMVDGGMRSGADVVRALAMGARAAMVGRSWAYGLCAAGQPGVARVLDLLRTDIDRTLRLMGATSSLNSGVP